jgi:hypothetical protein
MDEGKVQERKQKLLSGKSAEFGICILSFNFQIAGRGA